MTVVGLITISLTPVMIRIAYPSKPTDGLLYYGITDSNVTTASALAACFLAGMMVWNPLRRQESTLDRIGSIVLTICLSFWLSGLISGFAFGLVSKIPNSIWERVWQYFVGPLFFACYGGILGPPTFGPIAYIAGIAILLPLRLSDSREQSPAGCSTASGAHAPLVALGALVSLLSFSIAVASLFHFSYSLIVASLAVKT